MAIVLVASFWGVVQAAGLPVLPEVGSGLDQLDQSLYRCKVVEKDTRCARPGGAADQVAGEQVIEVVLFYRDSRLVRSVIVLDEQRFDHIATRLSGSWGAAEPTSEALKAGMGGVFDNRQYVWRREGKVWMLEQFFERIIHSGLCVTGEAGYEALTAERESKRVRGARDL